MGAKSSTPRIVAMDNPNSHYISGMHLEITQDVIGRLKNAKELSRSPEVSQNNFQRAQMVSNEQVTAAAVLEKTTEVEANHYAKTLAKFDASVNWAESIEEDVSRLRGELIKCYSNYGRRALACSNIAEQFQNMIFSEQYKAIVQNAPSMRNFSADAGDNGEY